MYIISPGVAKNVQVCIYRVKVLLNCVQLFVTSWSVAHQAPLSMEFCRKNISVVAIPFSRGSSQHRDQTQGLLHCRQILYQLSHQRSPYAYNNWINFKLMTAIMWVK